MNPFWQKVAAVEFLLFLALFITGLVLGYTGHEPDVPEVAMPLPLSVARSSKEDSRSELRTANNLAQIGLKQAPLPQVLDQENINKIQVYEKTAQLSSATTGFDQDEQQARKAIAAHKATVFSERRTGIAPGRQLSLGVAVHPDHFDDLLHDLERVGRLGSITVTQQDRTGEFRKLHGQRQSLKKHQEAILKLREGNKLSVKEALELEQKIQDVEKELQAVGVQLGDLLGKEPSYNLFVQLEEIIRGGSRDHTFTLAKRLGSAFAWAINWWAVVNITVGVALATAASVRTLWFGARVARDR